MRTRNSNLTGEASWSLIASTPTEKRIVAALCERRSALARHRDRKWIAKVRRVFVGSVCAIYVDQFRLRSMGRGGGLL